MNERRSTANRIILSRNKANRIDKGSEFRGSERRGSRDNKGERTTSRVFCIMLTSAGRDRVRKRKTQKLELTLRGDKVNRKLTRDRSHKVPRVWVNSDMFKCFALGHATVLACACR